MPVIEIENDGAYLRGKPGALISLSGGFGSEVNRIMAEQDAGSEDTLQKGSAFIAPIHVPGIVERVHQSYVDAGAGILTADSFCASMGRQDGNAKLVDEFITAAAAVAQSVADRCVMDKPLVALSLTSSGDCYKPEETPNSKTLIQEHRQNIELLTPHADLLIVETLPTLREGIAIAEEAQRAKKPFLMSFAVSDDGGVRDGHSMQEVVDTILSSNSYCLGLGVNCCSVPGAQVAVSDLSEAFGSQSAFQGKHIVAYPNGFTKSIAENEALKAKNPDHVNETFSPKNMRGVLEDLVQRGATVVGACCGSTPDHAREYVSISVPVASL